MPKNIVLIGLMGSGKTTIGRKLAEKLNMKFADTDELIIQKAQKSIKLIFAENGEAFFRKLESEAIEEVSSQENIVVSTGGGAVLIEENIHNLKKNGILFHLYAPADELFKRIKDDNERPLINTENPVETLKIIQERRKIFYNQADFKINTCEKTPEETANEIINLFVS
ncbi:MAG: shikimate kinase [bacterium]